MKRNKLSAAIAAVLLYTSNVSAEPLKDMVGDIVKRHPQVLSAKAELLKRHEEVGQERSDWFPELEITGRAGHEDQDKVSPSRNESLSVRQLRAEVTQLIADFGETNSSINRAKMAKMQAEEDYRVAIQDIMLDGITAYLDVHRSTRVVDFARQSESNIKKQTAVENILLQKGKGVTTNVLQAKVQLAGAQARKSREEGELEIAKNTYRSVFLGREAEQPNSFKAPTVDSKLPKSLEESKTIAYRNNPNLRAAQFAVEVARNEMERLRAEGYFPTIQAVAAYDYKDDVDGLDGIKKERELFVELDYDFDFGRGSRRAIDAQKQALISAEKQLANIKLQVEHQVSNAWHDLVTARKNANFLKQQVELAKAFLSLARKERRLGRRSLLDVLNGETTLINAQSDAISAEVDVQIAGYTLLRSLGLLDMSVFPQVASATAQAVTSTKTQAKVTGEHMRAVIVPVANLRNAPDVTSKRLGKVSRNEKVTVIKQEGDWLLLRQPTKDVKEGWIYAPLTKVIEQKSTEVNTEQGAASEQTAQTTSDNKSRTIRTPGANLRSGPSTSNEKIGVLPAGTKVKVIEEKESWLLVEHAQKSEVKGWVYAPLAVPSTDEQESQATVEQEKATQQQSQEQGNEEGAQQAQAQTEQVKSHEHASDEIEEDQARASAASSESILEKRTVTATSANLRSEPSVSAKKVGALLKNTEVDVVEKQDNWLKVNQTSVGVMGAWIYEPLTAIKN